MHRGCSCPLLTERQDNNSRHEDYTDEPYDFEGVVRQKRPGLGTILAAGDTGFRSRIKTNQFPLAMFIPVSSAFFGVRPYGNQLRIDDGNNH